MPEKTPTWALKRRQREREIRAMRKEMHQKKHVKKVAKYAAMIGALLFMAIYLSACGREYQDPEPGIYGDAVAVEKLRSFDLVSVFEAVKSCAGFEAGNFEDLAVTAFQGPLTCGGDLSVGCFRYNNTLEISVKDPDLISWIFAHEALHYLLSINIGHAFIEHNNQLFIDCT